MIHSMTAFARQEEKGGWGSAVWELRSVNHRYLEVSIRLPENLGMLENAVREKLRSQLQRGKIECFLRYRPSADHFQAIIIDKQYAQQVISASNEMAGLMSSSAPNKPLDILKWPGVIAAQDIDMKPVEKSILELFQNTLEKLLSARQREGAVIQEILIARLKSMEVYIKKIEHLVPLVLNIAREKLLLRFSEAKLNLDAARLEQEMVFFAQKIDVAEELDRLKTHVGEVSRILHKGGAQGRRLDFLMQELNREANTLGSKANDTEIISLVVELKVLIEQMREQIQNIE